MTVPDDITPGGVDLAMTAILLRAGNHGQEVPSYGEKAWSWAIAGVAERGPSAPSGAPLIRPGRRVRTACGTLRRDGIAAKDL